MVYGDLQFFDIIIFAVIAVFLIYRLRNVLGKRTGYEKKSPPDIAFKELKKEPLKQIPQLKDSEKKLETIYSLISDFDHKSFLEGAKKAFEIIITAFNKGDKKTLKNLVSSNVYNAFEQAIESKNNNPNAQFYSLIIDGIESAKVESGKIIISVKFVSEQLINNDEDKIVKNQDVWTFEKEVKSKSPIWLLTST